MTRKLELRNLPTSRPSMGRFFYQATNIVYDDGLGETWDGASTVDDIAAAKEIAEALCTAYPGHPWMVYASHARGIYTIKNPVLDPLWGYVGHIRNYTLPQLRKRAIQQGGEFLERFSVERKTNVPGLYDHLPVIVPKRRDPRRPPEA